MTMYNDEKDREVTFEIVEEIGIIATASTGWTKELNIVAWNGGQGKYDIREWSPHHDRMSRGITLNEQEMRAIVDMLKRRNRVVPRGTSKLGGTAEAHVRDDYAAESESSRRYDHVAENNAAKTYQQETTGEEGPTMSAAGGTPEAATETAEFMPADQADVPAPDDDEGWGEAAS